MVFVVFSKYKDRCYEQWLVIQDKENSAFIGQTSGILW